MARSSIDAEDAAPPSATQEVVWSRRLLAGMGLIQENTIFNENNQGEIASAKTLTMNQAQRTLG